jgi:hypothetical protein
MQKKPENIGIEPIRARQRVSQMLGNLFAIEVET